jgi:hypothetical protein
MKVLGVIDYDPETGKPVAVLSGDEVFPLAAPRPPVVIVTRHPDFENEFEVVGGEVDVFDIDLGSSFNGSPDDRDEAEDWALSKLAQASIHSDEVYEKVFEIVAQVVEDHINGAELLQLVRVKGQEYGFIESPAPQAEDYGDPHHPEHDHI